MCGDLLYNIINAKYSSSYTPHVSDLDSCSASFRLLFFPVLRSISLFVLPLLFDSCWGCTVGQKSISDNKTVDSITNYTIVFKSSKQQTKIVTFRSKDYTEIFRGCSSLTTGKYLWCGHSQVHWNNHNLIDYITFWLLLQMFNLSLLPLQLSHLPL